MSDVAHPELRESADDARTSRSATSCNGPYHGVNPARAATSSTFTPYAEAIDSEADADFGSGGVLLMPDNPGGALPVVSSYGTLAGQAIVWAIQTPPSKGGAVSIEAFDALADLRPRRLRDDRCDARRRAYRSATRCARVPGGYCALRPSRGEGRSEKRTPAYVR